MASQSHTLAAESEYGSVKVAARKLGVGESYLNKARVYGGGPPFVKLFGAVRYHLPTLLEWAASQTRRSTSDKGVAT